MKNILRYTILFCLLLFGVSGYPGSFAWRGLSASDGLADLLVNVIHKDSLGFVWLGTGSALERFDGIHIKHYPISGTDARLKRVNALAEMPGNSIWMGNGMGLWRLNQERNTLEQMVPDLIDCDVHALLADGAGTLYIGSKRGLFIYRDGKFKQVLLDDNSFSASNAVKGIVLDEQGTLWMTTGNGLCSLRLSDGKVENFHNMMGDKHICAFKALTRIGSVLYLGTMEQGIVSFDIPSKQFARSVDVGCNVISSLSSDGKKMLYVGTDGNGVHFIDMERKAVVRTMRHDTGVEGSLRSNSVYSLLVDRDGIIWVGFYQLGLDYTLYQGDLFSVYSFPPYFDSKDLPVRALAMGENEKLIGSRDGLFYVDEQNRRFKSFNTPEMRSGMVFSILFFEGEYYVGTYGGGMYVFDPKTLALRDFAPETPLPFRDGHIFCIEQDEDHNLWIGTSQGLFCYKNGKLTAHYTSANSKLPEGNVYEIYFDSTRKGWICTENGLCLWEPSSRQLRTDVFPKGFIHQEKIRVVYEDSQHRLYFFPDKGALFVSDLALNNFHRLQPGTPLEGRDGMFVIEDRNNGLWMGTGNGLFHYDKKDNFVPYNFVDGIPSPVFTLCPPVCDADGDIWFGNTKGLVCLDMARLKQEKRYAYPVRVTDVYINGKPSEHPVTAIADGRPLVELEPSQQNVTFCFSDFSYTSPVFLTYEYQLEGEDDNWTAVTGNSKVTYYNLSSGSYTFKVRRMGQPESETRLVVKIASALGVWIVSGVLTVLLLGGGASYFYRRKRKAEKVPVDVPVPVEAVVEPVQESKPVQEEKYKTLKVSPEECKRLIEKLEEVMRQDKPYIQSDLKIADLAAAIGTSAHTLSYLFNQHLERHYYDYVNDYRIEEFKRLANMEEYSKYTLSALAGLCGFSSRASFFRYFKKATGITPNEYIRSIGKSNE